MSRILIIEPFKNLRQALALAFFPEHEVETAAKLADRQGEGVDAFDLMIVDASALREDHSAGEEILQTIENSQVPTLWLTDDDGLQAPKRNKVKFLKMPVEREAIVAAVASLLSPDSSKNSGPPTNRESKEAPTEQARSKAEATADQESFDFIELVDVVDDPSQPGKSKKQPRKSK